MSKLHAPVVIAGFSRTPLGNFQGSLNNLSATDLGAIAINAALRRSSVDPTMVDEVLMGCVLSAGLGQAPARQAALTAGLPLQIGCTTINKMCGSGMAAIMLGVDLIRAQQANVVVAGGMESMSNAPYLLPKVRQGLRIGHGQLVDHMFYDGLEDPTEKRLMGCYAEECAEQYAITREQQDEFARQSLLRAQTAIRKGYFDNEIEPVSGVYNSQPITVKQDEHPLTRDVNKIGHLEPAFKSEGTVTAANSSCISDGAAAVVLMSESAANKHQIKPLAEIIAHQTYAQQPARFTTAPIYAIEKLLERLSMEVSDVDLFEINEAFAVVVLAAARQLILDMNKVNVHGGACALGHPIGASGSRIVVTLLSALQRYELHRGLASICIAGGEATALVIER